MDTMKAAVWGDFTASLGFEIEGGDDDLLGLEVDKFAAMIEHVDR